MTTFSITFVHYPEIYKYFLLVFLIGFYVFHCLLH